MPAERQVRHRSGNAPTGGKTASTAGHRATLRFACTNRPSHRTGSSPFARAAVAQLPRHRSPPRACPGQPAAARSGRRCRGSCAAAGSRHGASAARCPASSSPSWSSTATVAGCSPRLAPSATLTAMPMPRLRTPIACTPSAPILRHPVAAAGAHVGEVVAALAGHHLRMRASSRRRARAAPGRTPGRRRRPRAARRPARGRPAAPRSSAPSSRRSPATRSASATPVKCATERRIACCSGWSKAR